MNPTVLVRFSEPGDRQRQPTVRMLLALLEISPIIKHGPAPPFPTTSEVWLEYATTVEHGWPSLRFAAVLFAQVLEASNRHHGVTSAYIQNQFRPDRRNTPHSCKTPWLVRIGPTGTATNTAQFLDDSHRFRSYISFCDSVIVVSSEFADDLLHFLHPAFGQPFEQSMAFEDARWQEWADQLLKACPSAILMSVADSGYWPAWPWVYIHQDSVASVETFLKVELEARGVQLVSTHLIENRVLNLSMYNTLWL